MLCIARVVDCYGMLSSLIYFEKAGNENADLIVFGEGYVPGYPFWLSFTNVAEFDSELQKEMFSIYHQNAINVDEKDLKAIQKSFKQLKNWLLFRSN